MDLESDLITIVKQQFAKEGIRYKDGGSAGDFASRYLEMQARRVVPSPREVHFSNEIHDSLGRLRRETNLVRRANALEAWGAVFRLWYCFSNGEDVMPYLSKNIRDAEFKDHLLWDYGMHHFHLSSGVDKSGFVKRSDYLLFAIVADTDVFFVDVREHHDPEDLLWVRQDLLNIVHSNWPKLTGSHILCAVAGDTVTNEEKKELRRKGANLVRELGGHAIAPLGGGMAADGSSILCRWWALKLLHEIRLHEQYFCGDMTDLRAALDAKGMEVPGGMEFQLVLLDSLTLSPQQIDSLREDQHLSRDLCRMGFAIVEATTRSLIMVSQAEQS